MHRVSLGEKSPVLMNLSFLKEEVIIPQDTSAIHLCNPQEIQGRWDLIIFMVKV